MSEEFQQNPLRAAEPGETGEPPQGMVSPQQMGIPLKQCHVCGQVRPIHDFKTKRADASRNYGLAPGSMGVVFRYCPDSPFCKSVVERFPPWLGDMS